MRGSSRQAFTLLEVMLATLVVGMISVTLFRFVGTNLKAIQTSTEIHDERDALEAVMHLLEHQLGALPTEEQNRLLGQPLKFRGLSNDEITWRSGAGHGLLTTEATGDYRVTLTVQPVDERSTETELGLRRQPLKPQQEENGNTDLNRGGGDRKYNWLPLIRPMAALEIRYFDDASHTWIDTWADPVRLPPLVRVRLWKAAGDSPVEAVISVPSARLQQ